MDCSNDGAGVSGEVLLFPLSFTGPPNHGTRSFLQTGKCCIVLRLVYSLVLLDMNQQTYNLMDERIFRYTMARDTGVQRLLPLVNIG